MHSEIRSSRYKQQPFQSDVYIDDMRPQCDLNKPQTFLTLADDNIHCSMFTAFYFSHRLVRLQHFYSQSFCVFHYFIHFSVYIGLLSPSYTCQAKWKTAIK